MGIPPPPTVRLPQGSHPPLPSEAAAKPHGFSTLHTQANPTAAFQTCYKHKARGRVYKSRSRVERTHSQPSTPVIIYVPAPGNAMGNRDGSLKPSPAPITESLTRDSLLQSSMSTFHLWQNAVHAGRARSDYLNGSLGSNSLG